MLVSKDEFGKAIAETACFVKDVDCAPVGNLNSQGVNESRRSSKEGDVDLDHGGRVRMLLEGVVDIVS